MSQRITIIGGGPGGYTAAFSAAKAGAQVTLVEAAHMGGTCLNWGCIPTKTLKASADALETAHRLSEFGISGAGEAKPDMPAIVARKNKVSEILRGGLEKTCAKLKVTLLRGRGEVVNAGLVRVHAANGSVQDVVGDKVIIATGSSTLNLPTLPVDHAHIITSDDALELQTVPGRMLVVGGGVIGCELAFIFQALGSKVTVVEGLDRVLPVPSIDADLSKLIQREMKKRGIGCELARTATRAEVTESGVQITLGPSPFVKDLPLSAQKESVLEADVVLVAVGRVPNTAGLGLAEAGVETDQRGWIKADATLQTNVPGIYAVGDVLGPARIMLAHVASMEGLVAVRNCLGASENMDYATVPAAVFTSPEVATVGLTESQAREQGYNVACPQSNFRELGKAQAMGELAGLFKLVVDADSGKLLGAHLAGAHVSDIIAEPTLAMQLGAKAEDLARTIHAHPTLAEGIFETAHLL
ncbi:dihydrolipoyl dehydrogenase [Desulfomicrobium sp. ZS1]|uniref:dihydrolipoyl dehydrogenase n=1 Tax=Desulfomicrobium sp. ZS1 TaxID=2952228 RepID=UPI0020B39BC2|nr:dihydrolipoyl dehydrogenase [Desulfomicrobium sp. ZS1]UTF51145.1 dihydrolipoyl dehydrogenase [Desulfomicrobium sp. ZS1]